MYIVPSLKNDGPNNQMLYIIRSLKKFDIDIIIVSLNDKNNIDSRFYEVGVQIINCVININDILFNKTDNLYEIINTYNPDIIQTYGIRPDTALRSNKIKGKLITTVRCSIKQCYYADYGTIIGFFTTKFHKNIISDGRTIIACSDTVAMYNKVELKLHTHYVVKNAIDSEYKKLSKDDRYQKRQALGIMENEIVVISTGYLTEAKDPMIISNAIRHINKISNRKYVKVIFLGDGPLKYEIKKYNDPNIILAGHINNVSEWLDIADIYASASHFEGMPNAVLEGMRSSLPILLSDIPSHVEIVNNSKEYIGELFKVSNVESFIDAFNRLIDHNLVTAGIAAMNIIKCNYNSERLGKEYMKIYKELMLDR